MEIQAIKGFKDILQDESPLWRKVEDTARQVLEAYGFREVRLPVLEQTHLFARSIGEATDIVEKEMFTFEDRGGKSITLRPEGTAGAVRAYIEHGLFKSNPKIKLYYIGPMFRRERPQKGRLRQFHQIGAEAFGISSPLLDAELILAQSQILTLLGIADTDLAVNSLGCNKCRPLYRDNLISFLRSINAQALCPDCLRRRESNPMRVLDCKNSDCQDALKMAPLVSDFLCEDCKNHQSELEKYLKIFGVKYRIEPKLVRGLDYYTRTAFEFFAEGLGSQSAVSAGGRYDNLVEHLGGPPTPAVGFAMGMERVALAMPKQQTAAGPALFFALLGDKAISFALPIIAALRLKGIWVEMDYEGKKLKGLMKQADNMRACYTFIIGDSELESKIATLQNMRTGEQESIPLTDVSSIAETLARRFEKNN